MDKISDFNIIMFTQILFKLVAVDTNVEFIDLYS